MDFDHEEELLEWDMQTDENFDDILNDGKQNVKRMTRQDLRKISQQESIATSPKNWIKFGQDYDHDTLDVTAAERRSGDGDSIASHEQGKSTNEEKDTLHANDKQRNSFSKFSPKHDESGLTRFTVLNEEESDFEGFETSPMEFRGTLTTGNPSYKSQDSFCCKAMRYSIITLLALAVGIVIGFYMGQISNARLSPVNITPTTPAKISTTRILLSTNPTNLQTSSSNSFFLSTAALSTSTNRQTENATNPLN